MSQKKPITLEIVVSISKKIYDDMSKTYPNDNKLRESIVHFSQVLYDNPGFIETYTQENIISCGKRAIATGVDMNPVCGFHSFVFRNGKLAHDLTAKGFVQLYRNAGCKNIQIFSVYKEDEYIVNFNNGKWDVRINRSALFERSSESIIGFTLYMEYQGEVIVDEISIDEVRKIRDKFSTLYNSKKLKNPNASEFETGAAWDFISEMGRKTIARRAGKYAPLTPEIAAAIHEADYAESEPEKMAPEPATEYTEDEINSIREMCLDVINNTENNMSEEDRERARNFMNGRNVNKETGEVTEGNARTYEQMNKFFNQFLSEFIPNEIPS